MSWLSSSEDLDKKIQSLERAKKQLTSQVEALANDNEMKKKALEEAKLAQNELAYGRQQEATRALQAEKLLEQKLEEGKNLQSQRHNYETTISTQQQKLKAMEKQVQQLEKEIDNIHESRQHADNQLVQELQAKVKKLETRQALPDASCGHQAQIDQLKRENAALRQAPPCSTSKRRRRSSSFSGSSNSLSERAFETELETLRTKLAKSDRELILATNGLAALQKSSAARIKAAEDRVVEMEEGVDDVRRQVQDEILALKEQVADANADNVTLKEQVANLSTTRQNLDKQCATLSELAQVRQDDLDAQAFELARLKDREEELVTKLSAAQSKHDNVIREHQEQMESMEHSRNADRAVIEALQAELALVQQKRVESELAATVSREAAEALQDERTQLLRKAVELEKTNEQVQALESALQKQTADLQNAEQRCQVVQAEYELVVTERDSFATQLEEWSDKYQLEKQSVHALSAEVDQLKEQVTRAEARQQEYEAAKTDAINERQRLTDELASSLECVAGLRHLVGEHEQLIHQLQSRPIRSHDDPEVESLLQQVEDLQDEVSLLKDAALKAEAVHEEATEQIVSLQAQVEKLKQDLEEAQDVLQTKNAAMQFAEHGWQQRLEDVAAELARAQAAVEGKTAELAEANEEIFHLQDAVSESVQKHNLVMGAQVELEHCLQEAQSQVETLQNNRDKGDDQVATLLKQLDTFQHDSVLLGERLAEETNKAEALEHTIQERDREIQDLMLQVAVLESAVRPKGASADEVAPLVTRLRSERDGWRTHAEFIETEQSIYVAHLQDAAAELQRRLEDDSQEVELLRQDLQAASKDCAAAENAKAALEQQLQDQKQLFETRIAELESQLSNMNVSSQSLEPDTRALLEEKSELQGRVLRRTEMIGQLQREIAQHTTNLALHEDTIKGLEGELEVWQAKSKSLQEECDALRLLSQDHDTELCMLALTSAESEMANAAAVTRLQAQVNLKQTEVQSMTIHVQESVTRISNLEAVKSELEDTLREVSADYEAYKASSNEAMNKSDEEIARLQQEAAKLTSQVQHTEEMLGAATDAQHLQGKIEDLSRECVGLKQENAALRSQLDEMEHDLQHVQSSNTELQSSLKSLNAKYEILKERLVQEEEGVRAKESQNETFRRDIHRLSKEISTLRQLVNQKDETASRLETTLNMTRTEAETLVADFNLCSSELERRQAEFEEREQVWQDQEKELQQVRTEADRLRSKLRDAEAASDNLRHHMADIQKTTSSTDDLKQQVADLEEQLQQKNDEVEETDERYLCSLKDVKRLQSTVERLQVRCETLQRTVKTLEQYRSKSVDAQIQGVEAQDGVVTPAQQRKPSAHVASTRSESELAEPKMSRKRAMPSEFDPGAQVPPRAIAVTTPQSRKMASKPTPSSASRSSTEKQPSASQKLAAALASKPSLSATAALKRAPLVDAGHNATRTTNVTAAATLMASLAKLKHPPEANKPRAVSRLDQRTVG